MANIQNLGSKENPYDIIISGAGPVGLAAAIIGGRQNAKICVLEQASIPGPIARGETIHDDPIFAELLGENFFSSISTHQTKARVLNSPNCVKSFEIHRPTPSYLFPWRRLIDSLWHNAIKAGAYCCLNKRVIKPILEDGVCIGVELSDSELIYGRTVLACDGHQSLLGRFLNIPYNKINVPILKRKLSQYTDPYPGMTTFLLPAESLSFAPDFPPAAIYVFPHGQGLCEVGLSLFVHAARKLPMCKIPEEQEILRVFNQLSNEYSKLSQLLAGTKIESDIVTQIPIGGLFEPPMPIPGLIFIGDSAGFIKTTSGSGILASIQYVKIAVNYCLSMDSAEWNAILANKLNKTLKSSKIYRKIKFIYWAIDSFQTLILVKLKTPERINKKWWLFRLVTCL